MSTETVRTSGGKSFEAHWEASESERTDRLRYLRNAVWPKHPLGGDFAKGTGLCTERMYWFTKTYMETDGLPWKIRRAMAIATYLENVPIFIIDHAQLVSYDCSRPNMFPMHQEVSPMTNDDLFYERRDNFPDAPFDKNEIRKMLDYWEPRSYESTARRYVSMEEFKAGKMGLSTMSAPWLEAMSSANIPHDNYLRDGMETRIDRIEAALEEAEEKLSVGPGDPSQVGLLARLDQYKAMITAGRGWQTWMERYSRLAKIIADNFETDAKRKSELVAISERCKRITKDPPETFHDAVQLVTATMCVAKLVERSHGGWAILPDQVFWPYYEKDVKKDKTLTKEQALEILCEWRVRIYEYGKYQGRMYREAQQGMADPRPISIGGLKPDGTDACNEITELICDSIRIMRTPIPSIAFRYDAKNSVSALRAAYESLRNGNGMPSFEHNGTKVDQLMGNFGVSVTEARTWANVVCKSPGVTTDGGQSIRYSIQLLVTAKALELALYNGNDAAVSKLDFGPRTGEAEELDSWDKFRGAIQTQMNYVCDLISRVRNKCRWIEGTLGLMGQPFLSCLYDRCIDLGVDAIEPYEIGNPWFTTTCMGDMCESLYPIKKLVYEDKKYSLRQLVEALKVNWEGHEEMRQEFLNLPKWGNDVDEVDEAYLQGYDMVLKAYKRGRDLTGATYLPLPNTNGTQALVGRIGALPYGRRLGEAHTDGGCSPIFGADKRGPTAVLRSCAKIDAPSFKGILLNQRLSPTQLAGEKGFQLWMNYMKTWYDMRVDHVQFNMVDNQTLRAAQNEPEKYNELIVRVAGWSSLFNDINRTAQDSIIARTVQEV